MRNDDELLTKSPTRLSCFNHSPKLNRLPVPSIDPKRKGCTIALYKDGDSLASDSSRIHMGGGRALGVLCCSPRARRGSFLPKTVSSIADLFP